MDFTLSDSELGLKARVRELAEREFRPRAARWDEDEEYPQECFEILRDTTDLLGLTVPEAYGGQGRPLLDGDLALEEIARACFNTALICQMFFNGPPRAIKVLGTEEQRERFLPPTARGETRWSIAISEPGAGSAVTDLATAATPVDGGVRLNGDKCFITGGNVAERVMVFARWDGSRGAKGIGSVVVQSDFDGFEVGAVDPKMGTRGVAEAELRFRHCFVPESHVIVRGDPATSEGFKTLMDSFNPERVGNAAMCLGAAQGALDEAIAFAREHTQFGRPICEFQGIQWMLADMALKVEAARLLVYRAAATAGEGFPATRETALAKAFTNVAAQEVCNAAIQIFGHRGVTRHRPVERMFRDVRMMALGGGSVEILKNVIASIVLERRFDQRGGNA